MTADFRILRALRTAPHPLTLPELAEAAQLSRPALAERLAELNKAGYEIALHPHIGCRLLGAPDRLIADDLAGMLACAETGAPPQIGREILVFEETGSTNDVAARLARSGAQEGLAVFAERQTSGRGRLGRRWESASHKGLWFSVLLRPALPLAQWPRLTAWAAVAVARGLEEALPGCNARIKWPNDIYLNDKKAVGILIESVAEGSGSFAVVGVGVNVNHSRADFPQELAEKATSLREAAGPHAPTLDRQKTAAALLKNMDALYPAASADFRSILAEAQRRSLLLGRWVEVRGGAATAICGVAEALEECGALRIRQENGETVSVSGGEVTVFSWNRQS